MIRSRRFDRYVRESGATDHEHRGAHRVRRGRRARQLDEYALGHQFAERRELHLLGVCDGGDVRDRRELSGRRTAGAGQLAQLREAEIANLLNAEDDVEAALERLLDLGPHQRVHS